MDVSAGRQGGHPAAPGVGAVRLLAPGYDGARRRAQVNQAPHRVFRLTGYSKARAELHDRGESPEDQALAVKRHRIGLRAQAPVVHHLRHRRVPRGLVRPFDPRENHHLVILRLHGTTKVSELAVLHIVSPALEDAGSAMLDENRVSPFGVFDELLPVLLGYCDHKPVDVTHVPTPAAAHPHPWRATLPLELHATRCCLRAVLSWPKRGRSAWTEARPHGGVRRRSLRS